MRLVLSLCNDVCISVPTQQFPGVTFGGKKKREKGVGILARCCAAGFTKQVFKKKIRKARKSSHQG